MKINNVTVHQYFYIVGLMAYIFLQLNDQTSSVVKIPFKRHHDRFNIIQQTFDESMNLFRC